MEMLDKLKGVPSPSSSKPEEDDEYYHHEEDDVEYKSKGEAESSITATSIPMAHREYEKMLRQLEAECRTHIKCE